MPFSNSTGIMQPRRQGLLSYWDGDWRLRLHMTIGHGDEVGHDVQTRSHCKLPLRSFGDQSNHNFIQSQPAGSNLFETKQC